MASDCSKGPLYVEAIFIASAAFNLRAKVRFPPIMSTAAPTKASP